MRALVDPQIASYRIWTKPVERLGAPEFEVTNELWLGIAGS